MATYEYDSWGNVITIKDAFGNTITDASNIAIINPYRYRSYYYDKETNLYYLNSRYYNPIWGRFINVDGIINADKKILGYNLYGYVNNNFINYYDKLGTISSATTQDFNNFYKGLLKIFNTSITFITQSFYPNSSEMMRESLVGNGKLNNVTKRRLIDSFRKSSEFKEVVKKEIDKAKDSYFDVCGSSGFEGYSDLRLSVGRYNYRLEGKKSLVDNKLGDSVWEINVKIWDEYDFDKEGIIINYYGAFMEEQGVIDPYHWDINFIYLYFE